MFTNNSSCHTLKFHLIPASSIALLWKYTNSDVVTRQAMYLWRNTEALSCKHCCSRKAISITYSANVCVCSLRYLAWNPHGPKFHPWRARLYYIFPHFFINVAIFEKQILLDIKYVLWFSLQRMSKTFFTLRRNELYTIKNLHKFSCKVLLFLLDFKEICMSSTDFRKNSFTKF
jgi:hypothetical protein